MRNLLFLLFLLTGCIHRGNDISFKVKDSDDTYELSANYDPDKTERVQEFLDEELTGRGDVSFENAEIDADLTLDDHSKFYIRSEPGELLIRMKKDENSRQTYHKMKKLGEGLQDALKD